MLFCGICGRLEFSSSSFSKTDCVSRSSSLENETKTILFNLCGHGHFDMQAYIDYFDNKLFDSKYSESEVAMALSGLPSVG